MCSDNGLSFVQSQTNISTNDGLLLIDQKEHFIEIEYKRFAIWKKVYLKMKKLILSAKSGAFHLGLDELCMCFDKNWIYHYIIQLFLHGQKWYPSRVIRLYYPQ